MAAKMAYLAPLPRKKDVRIRGFWDMAGVGVGDGDSTVRVRRRMFGTATLSDASNRDSP